MPNSFLYLVRIPQMAMNARHINLCRVARTKLTAAITKLWPHAPWAPPRSGCYSIHSVQSVHSIHTSIDSQDGMSSKLFCLLFVTAV